MNVRDYLTEDGQAILLLCSSLGCGDGPDEPAPFKLSEWNQLARKIQASSLKTPAGLLGKDADELAVALSLAPAEAERINRLFERGGAVAMMLDNLLSRGIWAVTRYDPSYPARLKESLKAQAPSVLFGAGDIRLLERGGVAIVGSRSLDEAGAAFTRELGRKTAAAGWAVVSGGARGTDRVAMDAGLQAGGVSVGVMADSLERTIRQADVREFLLDGRLVLVTPYGPDAGFSIGAAMGRNKVIYGLADFAVIVSSDHDKGGTWAGAVEALKGNWRPVFVRASDNAPRGNRELVKLGGVPFPETELPAISDLPGWLGEHVQPRAHEQELFPLE